MARTRTLAQLRTEVLQTSDTEGATLFLGTGVGGEVDRYINASIQDLYDLLVESQGQEFFLKSYEFPTVGGQAEYTISVTDADLYLVRGVDLVEGSESFPLRPYSFQDRHQETWLGFPRRAGMTTYRLFGVQTTSGYTHKIRFTPTPDSAETIRLWYIPHPPQLTSDSHVFDGFNGWEEYVVVDAAIKILQKEESDTQALELRKSRLIERIKSLAPHKDLGGHESVALTEEYDTWP